MIALRFTALVCKAYINTAKRQTNILTNRLPYTIRTKTWGFELRKELICNQ